MRIRSLALIQDPKNNKHRTKIEEKWRIINKLAAQKNPNFKEPTSNLL